MEVVNPEDALCVSVDSMLRSDEFSHVSLKRGVTTVHEPTAV